MPTTAEDTFSDTDRHLAQCLKALAHPARLAIVRLLAERDECVCGEIVADLPLAQSTVSQHLKALKEAGLIRGAVEGRSTCYCLDPEAMQALDGDLRTLFDDITRASTPQDCC